MRFASWLRRPIVWVPISIGLLVMMIVRSRIWEAGAIIANVQPGPVLAAAALCLPIAVLWAVRSADLLAAAHRPVGIMPLIPMTTFANTINNLTPGSAGEIVRMYLLRAHHDVDYATSGAVVFVERVGAIGYLATSALLAWCAWLGLLPQLSAAAIAAALVVAPPVAYRLGLRPLTLVGRLPGWRLIGSDRWARFRSWLSRVDATVAVLVGSPRHFFAFVILSMGIFTIYTAQMLLLAQALQVRLEPLAAWGALGLSTTIGVLSLLPFGLGTTDLALTGFLGIAGVAAAPAVTLVVGYRLVSTLPLSIAGIVSFGWLSARLPASGLRGAASAVRAEVGDPLPDLIADA